MARTLRDAKLDTREARSRLKARRNPYWRALSPGMALGYRKAGKHGYTERGAGGTWIARRYDKEHGLRYRALGAADDIAAGDGEHVLSFAQAQRKAMAWFEAMRHADGGEPLAGPYSVSDALRDYVADYTRRGGKGLDRLQWTIKAHIDPGLGTIAVEKLTRSRIEAWIDAIAAKPPRLRTKAGKEQQYRVLPEGLEAVRQRRSSANRILTVLKAALNLAYERRRVAYCEAWDSVRPFREADAAKVRYLSDDEARRLVNACPADLRALVAGALLTGCRYGELAATTAADFDAPSGTLHIARSKGGRPRHVPLTDEGRQFFAGAAAGKGRDALLFTRQGGEPWGRAHQFRPLKDACERANIQPGIGFHALRHTYASRLAMRGVSMAVIAAALGHSDQRICERFYAHMSPSYIHDTVRAAFGNLGIVPATNVVPLAGGG